MVQPKRTVFMIFSTGVFAAVIYFVLRNSSDKTVFLAVFIVSAVFFALLFTSVSYIKRYVETQKFNKLMTGGNNALLVSFTNSVHFSNTNHQVVEAIRVFEKKSGCTVVFSEYASGVIYADWERNKPVSIKKIEERFKLKKNGIYFFSAELNPCSARYARGFALKARNHFLFLFHSSVPEIHPLLIKKMYEVFCDFIYRAEVFESLSHTGHLVKEWSEIEKTQYSFLPKKLPTVAGLEAAAYFLPLANVSGDYYSMLPVSKTKTLILLGDVSGKGLAAALVMGVVINAIKTFENKEDLPGIIHCVDTAIKFMRLQEKFTVLFVGIVDTAAMELRYINASMADTLIIRGGGERVEIRELQSNCPLLGIIEVPPTTPAIEKLYFGDMILLSSDGVSETGYASGASFGETDLYKKTIRDGTAMRPASFVEHLAATALKYGNNGRLRDDITILALRVTGAA